MPEIIEEAFKDFAHDRKVGGAFTVSTTPPRNVVLLMGTGFIALKRSEPVPEFWREKLRNKVRGMIEKGEYYDVCFSDG